MLSWSAWLSLICEPGGEGEVSSQRTPIQTSNRVPRPTALAKSAAKKINDALSIQNMIYQIREESIDRISSNGRGRWLKGGSVLSDIGPGTSRLADDVSAT
jgi:hypothetical protein